MPSYPVILPYDDVYLKRFLVKLGIFIMWLLWASPSIITPSKVWSYLQLWKITPWSSFLHDLFYHTLAQETLHPGSRKYLSKSPLVHHYYILKLSDLDPWVYEFERNNALYALQNPAKVQEFPPPHGVFDEKTFLSNNLDKTSRSRVFKL